VSKLKIIIFIIVLLFILGLATVFFGCRESPGKKVTLEFWGVFDDSDIYQPLIDDFNREYPNITIKYTKKTYQDYEKDLLETMAAGRGPDIFMLHNTWLPRYQDKIWPVSSKLITLKEFQESFVDVAVDDFVLGGDIWAIPLYVDTLALYYNKDIFNTVGIPEPPETWEEFMADVEKLTIRDTRGNIIRAGAAIGTARNVNRSTDILSLLMLQSGTQMVDQEKTKATFDRSVSLEGMTFYPGERALQFYTDFANPLKSVYTWNTRMHYSIDAFYEGQTAMMFNYSYHLPTIRAKSPYLNFAVAPLPQIKTSEVDVNYANYWGLTVSKNSEAAEQAWRFIVWLSQKENTKKYLEAAKKPTARRDLIAWQKDDLDLGVFARQALTAHSWYQVDSSAIETILADMIESVVLGEATVKEAINKAAAQVTLLMRED
jgi:multiple sugar transport system substrate-binding protein